MSNHRNNTTFRETGCRLVLVAEPAVRNTHAVSHQSEDGFAQSLPVLKHIDNPASQKMGCIYSHSSIDAKVDGSLVVGRATGGQGYNEAWQNNYKVKTHDTSPHCWVQPYRGESVGFTHAS